MKTSVSVIVGLGNPGSQYETTRHNAGFWLVDALARAHHGSFRHERRHDADICRVTIADKDIWLVKPHSYMNESGGPTRSFLSYFRLPLSEVLVAHDEIDLPVATLRLKKGGGHGGHNGLRDMIACLGRDFMRLRIGVGHPGTKDQVTAYVLRRASADEQVKLDAAILKAADVVPIMVKRGFDVAMNRLNVKPKRPAKPKPEPDAEPAGTDDPRDR